MRIRWKKIARVAKTHARSGEVVVESVHGLPSLLKTGMTVALVPPALKGDRFFTAAKADGSGGPSLLVSFEGVSSIGEAQELVGRFVLADVEDLPDDVALLDRESLIGTAVIDATQGMLGTVSEVMAGPAQDVLVLEHEGSTLLVPFIDEFYAGFDEDGHLLLDLPDGAILEEEA